MESRRLSGVYYAGIHEGELWVFEAGEILPFAKLSKLSSWIKHGDNINSIRICYRPKGTNINFVVLKPNCILIGSSIAKTNIPKTDDDSFEMIAEAGCPCCGNFK